MKVSVRQHDRLNASVTALDGMAKHRRRRQVERAVASDEPSPVQRGQRRTAWRRHAPRGLARRGFETGDIVATMTE